MLALKDDHGHLLLLFFVILATSSSIEQALLRFSLRIGFPQRQSFFVVPTQVKSESPGLTPSRPRGSQAGTPVGEVILAMAFYVGVI